MRQIQSRVKLISEAHQIDSIKEEKVEGKSDEMHARAIMVGEKMMLERNDEKEENYKNMKEVSFPTEKKIYKKSKICKKNNLKINLLKRY